MNGFDLSTVQRIYKGSTLVDSVYLNMEKIWPLHDYSRDYLTITSLTDNNSIGWKADNQDYTKTISVSTDSGRTWTDKTSSLEGTELAILNTGANLLIKGNNTSYGLSSNHYTTNNFTSTNIFDISGNIMSLVYGDNFRNQTTLQEERTFIRMFYNTKVISAQNLVLPATSMTISCYSRLFENCSYLTTAPKILPALVLNHNCYDFMFSNCTNLVTPPELPAMTLSDQCYGYMFKYCTSLTTPPELPATTLAEYCYYAMFLGCSGLITAPELPASTLAIMCYSAMFADCTNLNYIKMLATDISAANCLNNWVQNVSSTGTFIKKTNTTIPTGSSGIPESWTVQNI